ncbi:DUF6781 family protein [Thalassovita taeanensis]|uniref:Uncharacterized protein n=1 Tax=Thalassovita taeanensis TaxID=657014 RepID=A0A1H9EZP8_9RHOB|nr:DUF6781 family protein [Thalassovita taeanensis]SEQ31152.1 hypothetical protein SAMN04488092_105235 [Thalassovita taeanensis]
MDETSDKIEQGLDVPALRSDTHAALIEGDRIQEAVRDVVVRALSSRPLSRENVKEVIEVVLDEAADGASESGVETTDALKQASAGIDDALSRATHASKLALEEATGRVEAFSETDLKQAADDLVALDKMYLEVLRDLVKSGRKASHALFKDLVTHVERSSADTGKSIRASLEALQGHLPHRPHLSDLGRSARTGMATVASIGSGILAGLSDSLAPSQEQDKDDEKPKQKDA